MAPRIKDIWAVLLEQERELAVLRRQVLSERHLVGQYRFQLEPLKAEVARMRQTPLLGHLLRVIEVWRQQGIRGVGRRLLRKISQTIPVALKSRAKCVLREGFSALFRSPAASAISPASVPASPPNTAALDTILAFRPRQQPSLLVDIIVPVYKGLEETLCCIQSLLRARPRVGHEIIVINDQSPDPVLVACLEQIAAAGLITLLHNPVNLGFVGTTNRGLTLHEDRDVVLLNSDTEVFGDWLDRLRRAAYSDMIGSVTPLSNNATICSYPHFCQDNELPVGVSAEELDQLCSQLNPGATVEVPTGVGFCMYVRRGCLDDVGLLDIKHFGRGYGEENDFCMRALARGWRHILTTDTFVYHRGAVSFGASKSPAVEKAMAVLEKLHPTYMPSVHSHLLTNPALPYRRRIDLALLGGPRPTVLYVLHDMGGGTERHVFELAERMESEGYRALTLRPHGSGYVRLAFPGKAEHPNLLFAMPEEYWTLCAALRQLGVVHVHFHHGLSVHRRIHDLPGDLGVPYDWTIHDYYSVCPRINLMDESRSYCGEPGPEKCNRCLAKNRSYLGDVVEIGPWREDYRRWLAGARRVFVPHEDVARRLARYFPELACTVRRHFEEYPLARPLTALLQPGKPLRVAIIGAIGVHKGVKVLQACAVDAYARKLPLSFHVVGSVDGEELFQSLPNVTITGSYREEEVFDLLAAQGCHCAFFPSVWPETYCFTLSVALAGGLYPVAFDLGAPAERIREWGWGQVLPLPAPAATINDELLRLRDRLPQLPPPPPPSFVRYRSLVKDYYGLSAARVEAA